MSKKITPMGSSQNDAATPNFLKKLHSPIDMMDVTHSVNSLESDNKSSDFRDAEKPKESVSEISSLNTETKKVPNIEGKDTKDYTLLDWMTFYKVYSHKTVSNLYVSPDMKELINQMKSFPIFSGFDKKDILSAVIRKFFEEHKEELMEYKKEVVVEDIWK